MSETPTLLVTAVSVGLLAPPPADIDAQFTIVVDTDGDAATGCAASDLDPRSNLAGAELVVRLTVGPGSPLPATTAIGSTCRNGAWVSIDPAQLSASAFPQLQSETLQPISGLVSIHLPDAALASPLADRARLQVLSRDVKTGATDRLPRRSPAAMLDLSYHPLPACAVNRPEVRPGETNSVRITGLPTSAAIALSFPGVQLATGAVDGAGNASIDFLVPSNTRPGLRSISARVPGTAFTASCAVRVGANPITPATAASVLPPPNPSGWNRTDVAVTLSAIPITGGADVDVIHYSASGAQAIADSSGPSPLALAFTAEGRTALQFYATDQAGITEAPEQLVLRIDRTPPTISAARSPAPNVHGWNNGTVTVSFTCGDALSGVADCTGAVSIASEGANQVIAGTALDTAWNTMSIQTLVSLDRTPPTIAYSGNQGSYDVDQSVAILCAANDALSGIASSTCSDINGPAYDFTIGTNRFSASAVDRADNAITTQVSFEVHVTFGGLCRLATRFVGQGGIANSLCSKLQAAEADAARGNQSGKQGVLGAFEKEIRAQAGKALTDAQAQILLRLVAYLR